MEVRRRQTAPWLWGVIVGVVAIAVLLIVWLVAAQSDREEQLAQEPEMQVDVEEQPQPPPPGQVQETPDQDRTVIIRERERVREVVRERPVYVYVQRPEDQQVEGPEEVVVVPRESQSPGTGYERVNVPAEFQMNDRQYVIVPGTPVKGDPDQFVSTGMRMDGHTTYYMRGTDQLRDSLYIRLRPDSNVYIEYQPVEE